MATLVQRKAVFGVFVGHTSFKTIQSYSSSSGSSKLSGHTHPLLNAVGRAVKETKREIAKSRSYSAGSGKASHRPPPVDKGVDKTCAYQPSKISHLKHASIEAYSPKKIIRNQPNSCNAPLYIPTKIDRTQSTHIQSNDGNVDNCVHSDKTEDLYTSVERRSPLMMKEIGEPKKPINAKPVYVPTPIDKIKVKTEVIDDDFNSSCVQKNISPINRKGLPPQSLTVGCSTVQYNPTPINQLQNKPKVLQTELEYDPTTNSNVKIDSQGYGENWKRIAMSTEAKFSDSEDEQTKLAMSRDQTESVKFKETLLKIKKEPIEEKEVKRKDGLTVNGDDSTTDSQAQVNLSNYDNTIKDSSIKPKSDIESIESESVLESSDENLSLFAIEKFNESPSSKTESVLPSSDENLSSFAIEKFNKSASSKTESVLPSSDENLSSFAIEKFNESASSKTESVLPSSDENLSSFAIEKFNSVPAEVEPSLKPSSSKHKMKHLDSISSNNAKSDSSSKENKDLKNSSSAKSSKTKENKDHKHKSSSKSQQSSSSKSSEKTEGQSKHSSSSKSKESSSSNSSHKKESLNNKQSSSSKSSEKKENKGNKHSSSSKSKLKDSKDHKHSSSSKSTKSDLSSSKEANKNEKCNSGSKSSKTKDSRDHKHRSGSKSETNDGNDKKEKSSKRPISEVDQGSETSKCESSHKKSRSSSKNVDVYHSEKSKTKSEKPDSNIFSNLFGDESDSDSICLISSADEMVKRSSVYEKQKKNLESYNKKHHHQLSVDFELGDGDYLKNKSSKGDKKSHVFNGGGETTSDESESDGEFEDDYPVVDPNVSDDDTYEECLQIFNESKRTARLAVKQIPQVQKKPKEKTSTLESLPGAEMKKRKAHQVPTQNPKSRKIAPKPFSKLSPAQVMHNRMLALQKQTDRSAGSSSNMGSSLLSKKRSESSKLTISTNEKGTRRLAHVSAKVVNPRPTIPAEFGSKVPVSVRQTYLNKIIDECIKMYDVPDDAYQRALNEEKSSYERSSSRSVYLNVTINTIKRLRSEAESGKKNKLEANIKHPCTLSHQAQLGGAKAAKTSYSIQRKTSTSSSQLTEAKLYEALEKYILTDSQLVDNGFPRINPDKNGAAILLRRDNDKKKSPDSTEKICVRCGAAFKVTRHGVYLRTEECVHHWGKCFKRRVGGGGVEQRFTCCQGDFSSEGCQVGKCHVYDDNKYDTNIGYVRTLPSSPPPGGVYKVYAMDCEMVYTTGGLELARVTVIDHKLEPTYESTVLPSHKIIDCNTRFSGLTEKDFKNITTKLRDVQAVLLSMFCDRTILIGHSLESDLISLKLIHSTVVDTSVVFPHRLGPPYKRGLKTLMAEYLNKIIQDDEGGHDSHEDAQACMELMLWKIKEDSKKILTKK